MVDVLLSVEGSNVGRGGICVPDVEVVEVSIGVGDVVCVSGDAGVLVS